MKLMAELCDVVFSRCNGGEAPEEAAETQVGSLLCCQGHRYRHERRINGLGASLWWLANVSVSFSACQEITLFWTTPLLASVS